MGYQAGYRSRANSVSIGNYAGSNRYYTAGGAAQNTCVGTAAGGNYYNYYRVYCTDVGYYSGHENRSGDYSVHIGHSADGLSTDIDYSVVVGTGAKTAASSVSIGHQSQASGNSGSTNIVSIGYQAGYDMDG